MNLKIREIKHMQSFKKSKFITQRPGSSFRASEIENSDYDTERRSRIPRLPKRTYSLEGKYSQFNNRPSNKNDSTSMIPRLEKKKGCKTPLKPNTAPVREKTPTNKKEPEKEMVPIKDHKSIQFLPELPDSCMNGRINDNFADFKNNVLRIPKYWTDAGETVSNVLKNTVSIVAKQYPTADVEAFELEIQNILKATETVKHQILAKTEDIITQANKIYLDGSEQEPNEEEVQKLTQKMEELRDEVNARRSVFEDLLQCGSEMQHLMQMEESEGLKSTSAGVKTELEKTEEKRIMKRMEMKKSKMVMQSTPRDVRRKENVTQSCGDVPRLEAKNTTVGNSDKNFKSKQEDKFTQTINIWTAELHRRNEILATLNDQILELHQLCKDHISKFKSFNLQIKLRGICNKAQHTSVSKEIQILNDEKMQLAEKNNKLQYYSKDLETAIKKKNLDLYHKEKVINQQKRLLHVRDELIEMLKTRCNVQGDKL